MEGLVLSWTPALPGLYCSQLSFCFMGLFDLTFISNNLFWHQNIIFWILPQLIIHLHCQISFAALGWIWAESSAASIRNVSAINTSKPAPLAGSYIRPCFSMLACFRSWLALFLLYSLLLPSFLYKLILYILRVVFWQPPKKHFTIISSIQKGEIQNTINLFDD